MWTSEERQAIRDAAELLRARGRGDGFGRGFGAVLDDVNPGALLLGLIVVAHYAVTVAAEAVSCSAAEMITRIAIDAGLEGR